MAAPTETYWAENTVRMWRVAVLQGNLEVWLYLPTAPKSTSRGIPWRDKLAVTQWLRLSRFDSYPLHHKRESPLAGAFSMHLA